MFANDAIQEKDIILSLSFYVTYSRISAFDQIKEYKVGRIVLAPYGGKNLEKFTLRKTTALTGIWFSVPMRKMNTITNSGFVLTSFAPDNENQRDWEHLGGIVATKDGLSFVKVYEDSFSKGTFETAEIGWSCDITDCDGFLILKADKGGYLRLDYQCN